MVRIKRGEGGSWVVGFWGLVLGLLWSWFGLGFGFGLVLVWSGLVFGGRFLALLGR